MTGPEAALAACRFLHDAAILSLWGAFAFLALLVPGDLARPIGRDLDRFRVGAIILAGLTAAAALPLTAASVGAGWDDGWRPAILAAVLSGTGIGLAWQVQALGTLLLASTLAVPLRRRIATTAAAAGLSVATLASGGHAAMHEGLLGLIHRAVDAVHALAAGAWLGALVPLLPVLAALDDPRQRRAAATALRRFSAAGHGAVALVVATGVANTALVLGRWPSDWSSPYQALLATKIALVASMVLLAVVHRYGLVPRLGADRARMLGLLRVGTVAEIVLGAAVLGCVAVFGLLDPL